MIYAIVGSRGWASKEGVRAYLDKNVTSDDIVVTGGAVGVDSYAMAWCAESGVSCIIMRPHDLSRKGDYLIRNKMIVDAAYKVVCFWDGKSAGTGFVIAFAKKRGKRLEIIGGLKE